MLVPWRKHMTIEPKYPEIVVQLTGTDGNVFAVMGVVGKALRRAGHADKLESFYGEATSGDYQHALQTCMAWVTVE